MVVLINLDSAVERRAHMAAQLDALGLAFERIGFDGRTRTPAEIMAWSRERFARLDFDFDLLSGAEVGCWISHLCAWDRLRASPGTPACTVLEDDLVLSPEFADAVGTLESQGAYDIVYLGTSSKNLSTRRRLQVGRYRLHEPVGAVFNTWGYVITRRYAERFFAGSPLRIAAPIDHYLGGSARLVKPRIAVLRPPVIVEHTELGLRSQIEPHTYRVDRWKLVEKARRRLLRSRISTMYYSLYRLL